MRYLLATVCVLFLICMSGLSAGIDVPGDFGRIQAAIGAAKPGDTIAVAPGIYRENIEINKGITLEGAGTDETTLLGAMVVKNADGVIIEGFTLDGERDRNAHRGIWCSFSDLIVRDSVVTGYHYGISSDSSRTVLENVSVVENLNAGVEIKNAKTALIRGILVADNTDVGILVALSDDDVLITDSVITGNRVGVYCVQSTPTIRRNVIKGNKIGVESAPEAEPDLGIDDDPGLNVIKDNECQIANRDRRSAVQAKGNYWGISTGPDISTFDGKVDYMPWLEATPLKGQAVEPRRKLPVSWGRLKSGLDLERT